MALFHAELAFLKPADIGAEGRAVESYFALVLEILQSFKYFVAFDGRDARIMKLVEVDIVGVQAAKGLLAGKPDELGLEFLGSLLVADAGRGGVVEVVAELGGDDHFMSAVTHELGEHLFAVALAVGVGGIEEVDAEFQGLFEQAAARLFGDKAPPVGGHSPDTEANFGEEQVGTGKVAVFHGGFPLGVVR